MSDKSVHTDHPNDLLPGYARGEASSSEEIERHLGGCESCRLEVELLRALAAPVEAMSDIERRRVYQTFEGRRLAGGGGRPGSAWLRASWRAAAGIALVLTSVGVLRVVQIGSTVDWDPDAALAGFVDDLADLDLSEGEVRMALGVGLIDDPTLDVPWDEADVGELVLPWEQER
ncbi:MAG: zf-HC2 domain-containing protein [Gemmatimonadota bacterium]|nr:zf-HC2 domain-containing protein [Gemmatimonadota bacterium]